MAVITVTRATKGGASTQRSNISLQGGGEEEVEEGCPEGAAARCRQRGGRVAIGAADSHTRSHREQPHLPHPI